MDSDGLKVMCGFKLSEEMLEDALTIEKCEVKEKE
jgi:hypothetical protein